MTDTGRIQQFLNSTKGMAAMFSLALIAGAAVGTVGLGQQQSSGEVAVGAQGLATQKVTVAFKNDTDDDHETEETVILAQEKKNLLVDQGRNFYQAKVAGTSFPPGADLFSNATYIALSNESSPQAGDVALQGEFTTGGLDRASCRNNGGDSTSGQYTNLGVGNYSCSVTFTATGTFNNVNMTGLMWNGTEGSSSLVAEVGFKSANILPDDQIVANWTQISFTEK